MGVPKAFFGLARSCSKLSSFKASASSARSSNVALGLFGLIGARPEATVELVGVHKRRCVARSIAERCP